jgi:uncharacterized alkaline shock family protein YloU
LLKAILLYNRFRESGFDHNVILSASHAQHADTAARAAVAVHGVVRLARNGAQVLVVSDGGVEVRLSIILRMGADTHAVAQAVQESVVAALQAESGPSAVRVHVNISGLE